MKYLQMTLVVVSGATIPVQIAVNKRLFETFRSPMLAVCATMPIGFAGGRTRHAHRPGRPG